MSIDNISKARISRNQIQQSNSREKKDLNRNHQAEMDELKTALRGETEQLRSEHRQQIVAEKERQAGELNRIRTELERTQKNLEQQKDFLISTHQKNISEYQDKQNEKMEINDKHFSEKLNMQTDRHRDVLHKANINFNEDQNQKFVSQKESLAAIDEKTKADLTARASQIDSRAKYENKAGDELVRNLKREKHHQFEAEDTTWKNKMRQQNTTNQIEFQRQDNMWKKTINDEMNNHQKLYANTLEQQKAEFKVQEALFSKENERIKAESSNQIKHVMKKTSDPFYQNSNIKPEVKDMGDSYKLVIPVADHEKDLYILNGHERTLTLSFSRDFKHDIKQSDNVSKTRRVESYSHSFFVPEIVKANTVSKNYENGRLTFNIKKA